MTSVDHQRVNQVFLGACDLGPAELLAYLNAECGDDAALRAEVERLLAHDETGDIELVGDPLNAALIAAEEVAEPHPEQLGKYRVLGCIGEGARRGQQAGVFTGHVKRVAVGVGSIQFGDRGTSEVTPQGVGGLRPIVDPILQKIRGAEDPRQHVVEIVRHPTGELPDQLETLRPA